MALVLTVLALVGATVAFPCRPRRRTDHGGPTTSTATTGADHDVATGDHGDGRNGSVEGGAGNDTLHGGAGTTRSTVGAGNNVVSGEDGDDTLTGGPAPTG